MKKSGLISKWYFVLAYCTCRMTFMCQRARKWVYVTAFLRRKYKDTRLHVLAICMYVLSLALKSKRIYVTIFFSLHFFTCYDAGTGISGIDKRCQSMLYTCTCICQILLILRKWGEIDRSKFQHLFQFRSPDFLKDTNINWHAHK